MEFPFHGLDRIYLLSRVGSGPGRNEDHQRVPPQLGHDRRFRHRYFPKMIKYEK
jgi:hypothetical protein